jgi:hypothetical protein
MVFDLLALVVGGFLWLSTIALLRLCRALRMG